SGTFSSRDQLTISVDDSARAGDVGTISVVAKDEEGASAPRTVTVTVVRSSAPLAQVGKGSLTLVPGGSDQVNVLDGVSNDFDPSLPLTLSNAGSQPAPAGFT